MCRVVLTELLQGQGGVPWLQIMESEFKCPYDRGGYGNHFAEKLALGSTQILQFYKDAIDLTSRPKVRFRQTCLSK